MQDTNGYPSPKYAWFMLIMLFLAYICSFIDRFIISLLVEPIKADLEITDVQISLLQGLAFVVLYTLCGIPIGRMVDSKPRVRIVTIGIAFWSVMTALCGAAGSFFQLTLARIGVGVGEATLTPSAFSIISDTFPPKRLGMAMGIYNFGSAVGGGIAMIVGGAVIAALTVLGTTQLPLFGEVQPWQLTFIIVGLPGLLIAFVFLFMKEPARREARKEQIAQPTLSDVKDFLRKNRATIGLHNLSIGIGNLAMVGVFSWLVAFFMRVHGWGIGDIGLVAGLSYIVGGAIGIAGGGWLSDRLSRKDPAGAKMKLCATACLLSVPFLAAFPLVDNPWLAFLLFGIGYTCMATPFGCAVAALQEVTPNRMRGVVSAIYIFSANIIGTGLGSTFVALATEHVFMDYGPEAIRYSMATVIPFWALVAAIMFRTTWRPYRRSHEELNGKSQTSVDAAQGSALA